MATGVLGADVVTMPVPGTTTQVIFNDAGTLAGDAGLSYNKTTDALTVVGPLASGNHTIDKADASIILSDPTGSNPALYFYDTTDGGGVLFEIDGTIILGGMSSAGTYQAARLSLAKTTGAATLANLAGTGTRAVEASSAGLLSASVGLGWVFITTSTFSASSAASVNSCFTSAYACYRLVITLTAMSAAADLALRLRVGGADTSSANYDWSTFYAASNSTNNTTGATASTLATIARTAAAQANEVGVVVDVYNPQVADETNWTALASAHRTDHLNVTTFAGGAIRLTTQYDGFTLLPGSGTISGTVRVYGGRDV